MSIFDHSSHESAMESALYLGTPFDLICSRKADSMFFFEGGGGQVSTMV